MALTRKLLKALNIEDEKIEEIITAHTDTVNALEKKIKDAETDTENLSEITKQRDKLQAELDKIKKDGTDAQKIQAEFDAYKTSVEAEKLNSKKTELIKKALTDAKANPKAVDLLMKSVDLNAVEMNGEALKDVNAIIKPIQDTYGDFFGHEEKHGTEHTDPLGGGGEKSFTLEQVKKMTTDEINKNWDKVKETLSKGE